MTNPVETDQATAPTMPNAKEGKKGPAAKNAIKHGLYARDLVLPWEDANEFEELHREYREEFNPDGRFEEDLVGQIAQLQWRKRRLSQRHMRGFTTDPIAAELEKIVSQGPQAIDDYVRAGMAATEEELRRNAIVVTGTVKDLKAFMKKADEAEAIERDIDAQLRPKGEAEPAPDPNAIRSTDRGEDDLARRAIERASRMDTNGSIKPVVDRFVEETQRLRASQELLDRVYRPQDEAANLRLLGSIDASIQKAIARLATAKEYKLRYGKHTVQADAAKTA
jgi:hypothetical protein